MNFSLGIHPFKDFWISCNYNMAFSLMTSIESSYKYLSYLNSYSYTIKECITPSATRVNYLTLQTSEESYLKYFGKILSSCEPLVFKNNDNYLDFLKNLVNDRKYVTIGVDLFYWIPQSICWDKHHWMHYSLIDGFDDEKKVFYVLDENQYGYDRFEIPEERFNTAIQSSSLEPHGYGYTFLNNPDYYELSLEDVIAHAHQLINNLSSMKICSLFLFSEEDFNIEYNCDLYSMYLFQISNRHKANELLFNALQNNKLITNKKPLEILTRYSHDLQDGWLKTKNLFVKTYYCTDKKSNIMIVNAECSYLLNKELEMWNSFLSFFCS